MKGIWAWLYIFYCLAISATLDSFNIKLLSEPFKYTSMFALFVIIGIYLSTIITYLKEIKDKLDIK